MGAAPAQARSHSVGPVEEGPPVGAALLHAREVAIVAVAAAAVDRMNPDAGFELRTAMGLTRAPARVRFPHRWGKRPKARKP
jgi:hypothetical protein